MRRRHLSTVSRAVLLSACVAGPAVAADIRPPAAPLSRATIARLRSQPALLHSLMYPQAVPAAVPPQTRVAGSPWQPLANAPPFSPGAMLQLGDGSVMVQDTATETNGGSKWWRLRPDAKGSYLTGTWSPAASMPAGYDPLYYASAILPDGRMLVEGGEYNNNSAVWSGLGALYDPVADSWIAINPPAGMGTTSSIGDAHGIVLANGVFMLSPVYIPASGPQQLFNAKTLKWKATGTAKASGNDEESQVLLPSGSVLDVDVNPTVTDNSEAYNPATGAWASTGSTIVQLWHPSLDEIGPHMLRPDGTVFAIGATGHNAIYNTTTAKWSVGPDFPIIGGQQFSVADGPAAVLPSGHVLVMASPAYARPSHFFEFDGKKLTQVADTPNAPNLISYYGYMLVLPTGQVLFNSRSGDVELYTETRAAAKGSAPVITAAPTHVAAGGSYKITGQQLSGVSQGAAYGDDYQSATKFPLVRIMNTATGDLAYARTYGDTKPGVAHGVTATARFAVPTTIETGASQLVVVANGVASAPVNVTVGP